MKAMLRRAFRRALFLSHHWRGLRMPHLLPHRRLLLLPAVLLLGACGVNPAVPSPARYALAPSSGAPVLAQSTAAPGAARDALHVRLGGVSAPAWLDDPGIVYQLGFRDPAQRAVYRDSRWVAPPVSLFAERLRERLSASNASDAPILQVELQEWTQIFSDPAHSDVLLRFRASLVPVAADQPTLSKDFSVRLAAPSANARGAVAGLSAASDEALESLRIWLASAH